ncbi:MAG: DUF2510 domain-containing protein [Actinomycetota bacterium]
MSDTPQPGWYDDPENPSQYRYWDGAEWTTHRSPKETPPPPGMTSAGVPTSATEAVSAAFTLFGQHWVSLLGLAAIALAGFVASIAVVVGGVFLSLDDAEDLFGEEVSEFVFNPIAVVLWVVGAVGYIAVLVVMGPAFQARVEVGRIGGSATVGACIGYGARNWKRTLGRGFLLWLTYLAALLVLVPLVLLAAALGGLGVFLAIVLGLAWFVAIGPVVALAAAGIAVAPTGTQVIRHAITAGREDWALVAGAFYLMYLVAFFLGIVAAVLGIIPILGIFANLGITFVSYSVFLIVQHFQWLRSDGAIDPAVAEMAGVSGPPSNAS